MKPHFSINTWLENEWQRESNKKLFNWFFAIFWVYALIAAICQPFKNDCLVFWAWAQQVYDSPLHGFDAIESVWEIKGLLSRLIYLQLYAFVRLFTADLYPYGHILFKVLGFFEINLLLALASALVPKVYLPDWKRKMNLFMMASLSVSTLNQMCSLQPEVWGFAMLFLSFALLLRGKWYNKVLGGIVLGLLFFLKTPMLLLSVSVFFAMLLVERKKFWEGVVSVLPYAGSALCVIVALLLLLHWTYPHEIQDLLDAAYFQSTLLHFGPLKSLRCFNWGITKCYEMPLNLPVLGLGSIAFLLFVTQRNWKKSLCMMAIWLFPYLYVVISNCYFIYHFVVFLPMAILTFFLTQEYWLRILTNRMFVFMLAVVVVAIPCSFGPAFSIFGRLRTLMFLIPYALMTLSLVEKWRSRILALAVCYALFTFIVTISGFSHPQRQTKKWVTLELEKNEKKGYPLGQTLGDGPVMQLNDGLGPLWITNPTYLRYMHPLPIQRIEESSKFTQSETFKQVKRDLLNYQGEYMVARYPWFFKHPHDDIKAFLDANYHPVDTLTYSSFYYDIYCHHPFNEFGIIVYKRND